MRDSKNKVRYAPPFRSLETWRYILKIKLPAVLGFLLGIASVAHATTLDPYADAIVSYTAGTGINTSFVTASAALGAPTTSASITAPAFSNTQIVGIGNGGQLTLSFNSPIYNDPLGHAGGMDFTIFGNDFFALGSGKISGAFTHTGLTVWVSQDNITYYQVHGVFGADDGFPTAGSGDPGLPVSGSLTLSSFNGLTAAQALALYNGSAGGASYAISSATDSNGDAVNLDSISYIKIEGTGGFGYVDAVARTESVEAIPEPSSMALLVLGAGGIFALLKRRSRRSASEALFATNRALPRTLSFEIMKTENRPMKQLTGILSLCAILLFGAGFAGRASAQTFDMSDIKYWVGSGTNEAAFVITFNDGKTPDSLVWGYKWNAVDGGDSPTVLTMMQAIATTDTRFQFTAHPNFNDPSGFYAVYSVYYDLTGLGGTPTVGTPGNVFDTNTDALGLENGHAPFPGDHYQEGWSINGFWDEYVGIGNPYNGGSWTDQYPDAQGVAFNTLSNDSWYAMSFSTDLVNFTGTPPGLPTAVEAVPEPSSIALGAFGAIGLLVFWRRKRLLA